MKLFASILVSVLLPVVLFAQEEPDYHSFKGRVKSCKEESFKAKNRNGEIVTTIHRRLPNTGNDFEIQYDSIGKKILKIEFDIDGESVKRKHHYTYDGYNQTAEVRIVNQFGTLIKSTRYLNTYDSIGRMLARYVSFSDQTNSISYLYSYSSTGTATEYFLSTSGNLNDKQISREFDSLGNLIKYWSYTQNGKLIGTAILTYDSLGNKVQEELFDKTGFNYLNYGWKFSGTRDPERYEICKANSSECESWAYKYEFDKTGNWIKRMEYRNGKIAFVKVRTISYFD